MTRTFVPPTSFISSPATEKNRLKDVLSSITSGFYSRHGFAVLPNIVSKFRHECIVIPLEANNLKPVDPDTIQKAKNSWQKVELPFWQFINDLFPQEIKWIGNIEIRLTKIGSIGGHYLLEKKSNQNLIIHLREDGDYTEIANLIILALIYPLTNDSGLTFTKRQVLRNFIMSRKQLKTLFPEWKAKLYDGIKLPIKLRKQSEDYLIELGLPKLVDPIEVITKNKAVFGPKEEKILKFLISNPGEIVTYDEMADLIWGEGNFKSYWALNKIVQRIQKKVAKIGADRIKITGIRGKGYKLTTQLSL